MHKFKFLLIKYWLGIFLIMGLLASLALIKLPNLSNLALQSSFPSSQLTNQADYDIRHWHSGLNNAIPISITYSVPTKFSNSQMVRLENKERFLVTHKTDLKIYRVTSAHTSPHAYCLFNGNNWHKLTLWIPHELVNSPLYQAQLRHLCSLAGIKTSWSNPINQQYQQLTAEWFQQKIICVWIFVITFLLLLLVTSVTTTCLVTLGCLEVSIISLSCITNLTQQIYFYLPIIIILIICLGALQIVWLYNPPHWLTKLKHPLQNVNPFLSLLFIGALIFPLVSNGRINCKPPKAHQTVTVYLSSSKSIINQMDLAELDRITTNLKSLKNIMQVTSLTQPGGKPLPKYQLGNSLVELKHNLEHKQQLTHLTSEQLQRLASNQTAFSLLQNQDLQLRQLQTKLDPKTKIDFDNLIKNQFTTQTALAKQINIFQDELNTLNEKLTATNLHEDLQNLLQIQQQTKHQFYLSKQDAKDSDFSQNSFNYNNQSQTITRLEVTLQNGELGNLPQLIKAQLYGTNFKQNIGMTGIPVFNYNQAKQFQNHFCYFILGLSSLIISLNWLRFKSFRFTFIIFLLFILATAASLGLLNFLTSYQFTPRICYFLLVLLLLLSLLPNHKNALPLTLVITVPLILVPSFRAVGISLLLFSLIYQSLLLIIIKSRLKK